MLLFAALPLLAGFVTGAPVPAEDVTLRHGPLHISNGSTSLANHTHPRDLGHLGDAIADLAKVVMEGTTKDVGNPGHVPLKFHLYHTEDARKKLRPSVAQINITSVDNSTGWATFIWSNATETGFGGKLNGLYLKPNGQLNMPYVYGQTGADYDDAASDPIHNISAGNITGEDAAGVLFWGSWTTLISEAERSVFERKGSWSQWRKEVVTLPKLAEATAKNRYYGINAGSFLRLKTLAYEYLDGHGFNSQFEQAAHEE